MDVLGITMIVLSLALLIFFAYRGYSIIFIAPVFAIVAALGGNGAPIECLPVFIVGPLIGAALAAFIYKALED